jgi:2-polyprenyl-6-methoxyphenol hydroxylase-like FAD-dependent oxidoreductase
MNVLISGGGVAGLAAAWWLDRAGWSVTVLERAKEYLPLGHFIALKAVGVQMVKDMGLYEACRAHAVEAAHLKVFSRTGRLLREGGAEGMEKTLDGYLFFKRAHLHAALYQAVREKGLVRFGAQLDAVRDAGSHAEADFNGQTQRFDLLLGADGIHSSTRERVFGGGALKPLGGSYLAMNLPGPHGLEPGHVESYFGSGQSVGLIPATADELTVMIYHGDGGLPMPESRDVAAMRAFLLEAYADFPEHVRAAFSRLDASSFVFRDTIARVELPSIVKGRIALLGDAAHCPTFMSGMGSSLALQDAHALAEALSRHGDDVPRALADYEKTVSPIAAAYQASAMKIRPFMLSRSETLRVIRDAAVHWTPEWAFELGSRRFYQVQSKH